MFLKIITEVKKSKQDKEKTHKVQNIEEKAERVSECVRVREREGKIERKRYRDKMLMR